MRRSVQRLILLTIFGICLCASAFAQDIKVMGGFLSDSLKVGERTAFYISARYDSKLTVLFPDSVYAFVPFEYQNRKYFPTTTDNGISFDSAVYFLTTFEVDRVQYLDLPVYVVQPKDCTEYRTLRDSVYITQLVAQVPDSLNAKDLPLKMNTAYQKVFFQFNTWIAIIVIGSLLVLGIATWLIFGKRISRYFLEKKLKRNHSNFHTSFNKFMSQLQQAFSRETAEAALTTWKKYMEQLEALPYTKLTTKETLSLVHDENLAHSLRQVDRSIYGHDTTVIDPLQNLKAYADQHFSKKISEVTKHGTKQ